ncbi:MAG: SAF domain-containing protein, partial [Propionibacteriaceae bacterium]|nr:SAF domain-containing protein [Propionibacteriaceae bacterium]
MMSLRPPHSGPQLRRSPIMVIAGVVLVIVGALVSVGLYSQLSDTQEVVAIVSPVARGEQIQRSDLVSVYVGFDPLLTPIPASRINQVVGMYATFDLVPGTFLVDGAIGDRVGPGPGQAAIGVALTAGEYPDDGLRPG